MSDELRRRVAFARAYLERFPVLLIGLAIVAAISVWQVGAIDEVAVHLFGPDLGPNVAAEVVGILLGGLITYFVIDQIQSRRERRRHERDIAEVVLGLSTTIGSTAMILCRIARGEPLRQAEDYELRVPGSAEWVRPHVEELARLIRSEPERTRIIRALSNPGSEEYVLAQACLSSVRSRSQGLGPTVAAAMPRKLADAIKSLEWEARDLSQTLTGFDNRILMLSVAFDLFLHARDTHRPPRIYGWEE